MNKKLLAVAVAGALAAPGVAFAQSSVTISGIFKASLENIRIGSPGVGRTGLNTSENRVADDSSRILFNVVEDLGGGLQAIAQLDWRVQFDQGQSSVGGNNHVGLRSKTMGRIFFGRQDLHYFNRESNLTDLAGSLKADSISLLAYMPGGTAIAAATRTPNVIHYTTPNWRGFTVLAAMSTSPNPASATTGTAAAGTVGGATGISANGSVTEGDIGTAARKGNAFNLNPNYEASNWQVGYSYWNSKPDGGTGFATTAAQTNATADQRSDRLYGSFKIAGFKLGLAWDRSRIKTSTNVAAGASPTGVALLSGTEIGNRTAWSLPLSYTMGNNQFHFHYTKARDDRRTLVQDGAKMVALSYQYTLSKRTSVGLTYAKITNDPGASYNLFTTTSLGSASAAVAPGEAPRIIAGTMRHAF